MSKGSEILEALKTRLESISEASGYTNTVRRVNLNVSEPTLNYSESELPLIEIINDSETYDHDLTSSYWVNSVISLFIVTQKFWTDGMIEDLLSDIRKCLYGGGASANGNTGMTLGGKVNSIKLIDVHSDLNMIESNRTYLMRIQLRSHRVTYRD